MPPATHMEGRARRGAAGPALALALAASLVAACGGGHRKGDRAAGPSALERQYPALRWVPADASWVATCARARDCVTAARELGEVISIPLGVAMGEVDQAFRSGLGASPLSLEDVAAAGIDLDAGAALFAAGGLPTAVMPVRDAAILRQFLDRERPERHAALIRHRGHDVYTWTDARLAVSWVALDGWLLVHAGFPPAEGGDTGAGLDWLDQVLAAPGGAGLGDDPDLARAARRGGQALGGEAPGTLAMVRLDRLARDIADWPGSPGEEVACLERAAAVAPRLSAAAEVSWDGASGWVALDLAPGAAAALRAHTAPPPPPGYLAYRRRAALSAAFAVELPWLEEVRAISGCPLLDEPIRDPVRAMTGMAGPRGWHLAASDLDPDQLSGAGAVHLVLTDRALVTAQLESIPGRSLFERSRRIAGREVKVLSLPGLPAIVYRQEGDRFTGSLGAEAMEVVLGPGDGGAAPPGLELAALAIEPPRLPHLGELISAVLVRGLGWGWGGAGQALAGRLARYERGALQVVLNGDSIEIHAGMRLRK